MSDNLAEHDEAQPYYQTRNVRVLWIPPRKTEPPPKRKLLVLEVAAGIVVAGIIIKVAVFPADQTDKTAAEAPTVHVMAQAPAQVVPEPVARPPAVPETPPPVIPPPRLRGTVAEEIARCKDPLAACTVDEVLQLGRELVRQRSVRPVQTSGR